jgi:hypothetical protein
MVRLTVAAKAMVASAACFGLRVAALTAELRAQIVLNQSVPHNCFRLNMLIVTIFVTVSGIVTVQT